MKSFKKYALSVGAKMPKITFLAPPQNYRLRQKKVNARSCAKSFHRIFNWFVSFESLAIHEFSFQKLFCSFNFLLRYVAFSEAGWKSAKLVLFWRFLGHKKRLHLLKWTKMCFSYSLSLFFSYLKV